jgi:hypothetical protein
MFILTGLLIQNCKKLIFRLLLWFRNDFFSTIDMRFHGEIRRQHGQKLLRKESSRSKESLKRFFENKKKETRKKTAAERWEVTKTGGGTATPIIIKDATFDLTMAILNKKNNFWCRKNS